MNNPQTAAVLRQLLADEFGSQVNMVHATGIHRSTIQLDLNGERKMPDDRFAAYLEAVSPTARKALVRARLLDLVPTELRDDLLSEPGHVSENSSILQFDRHATLTTEQQSALQWLADTLADDPDLLEPVMVILERLGWERPGGGSTKY